MSSASVCLMYHEIERRGRPLREESAGYRRYVVSESDFRAQMASLGSFGYAGVSTSTAISSGSDRKRVGLTFDDGSETDLLVAASVLREYGFGATFYITTGWIGKRGFMNRAQIRELHGLGFEIGCHGATHRFLTMLAPSDLRLEIVRAREELEQLIGASVQHFSCPGGRYNDRVTRIVSAAGYDSMATSDVGPVAPDDFLLPRLALVGNTSVRQFEQFVRGDNLLLRRLRFTALRAARQLLGHAIYESTRARFLARHKL